MCFECVLPNFSHANYIFHEESGLGNLWLESYMQIRFTGKTIEIDVHRSNICAIIKARIKMRPNVEYNEKISVIRYLLEAVGEIGPPYKVVTHRIPWVCGSRNMVGSLSL